MYLTIMIFASFMVTVSGVPVSEAAAGDANVPAVAGGDSAASSSQLATRQSRAIALLDLAVTRGVAVFNSGNPEACSAIYELAIESVLILDVELSEAVRFEVQRQRSSDVDATPVQRAWAFRHSLELVRANLVEDLGETPAETVEEPKNMTVFDFSKGTTRWRQLHDDVMGGISKGTYQRTANDTGLFSGALSLENNGGFATVRSPARNLGLEGFDGLLIRLKGDGRRYSLGCLPSDRRMEINTWRFDFQTKKNEWMEIRVPFASLQHSIMGRRLPTPPIAGEKIRSLSFMIGDKNEEPFRLEIDWVQAYRGNSEAAQAQTF